MRQHRYQRGSIAWKHALMSDAAVALPALETSALVFDGVGDYAYAANGAQGVGDTWSWFGKFNGRHGTSPRYFGMVYDSNAASPNMQIDAAYAVGNSVSMNGRTTAAGNQYQIDEVGGVDLTGVQVLVITHRNIPTRRVDWFITRGGLTIASGGVDLSAGGEARTPLHVGIAAAMRVISGTHTPIATTNAPTHFIASGIVNGVATEAEAQAYSIANNAKAVWPSPYGYWPGALIAAGAVANQGVGTANPLTVVGPTAADLEAL